MCALVTGVQTCALPSYRARTHAQAGPARRARHFAAFELGFGRGQRLLEGFVRFQRLRLLRHPRADLAAARAGGEVGVGFRVGHLLGHALDAHLHSTAHAWPRSEEHTSELQSLMRISYAVFCLKKKKKPTK